MHLLGNNGCNGSRISISSQPKQLIILIKQIVRYRLFHCFHILHRLWLWQHIEVAAHNGQCYNNCSKTHQDGATHILIIDKSMIKIMNRLISAFRFRCRCLGYNPAPLEWQSCRMIQPGNKLSQGIHIGTGCNLPTSKDLWGNKVF